MPRIGFIDRISLDEHTGCWNWRGPVDKKWGYGKTKWQGKFVAAHRLSAILWLRIDRHDPRCVLHKCDNPRCFNPKHLFMGTLSDNAKDCVAKGRNYLAKRTACSSGHPYTPETLVIRTEISDGVLRTYRGCKLCHNAYQRKYMQKKGRVAISPEVLHLTVK